jgi:protein-tyrosine phosphatase
VHCFMGMSRSAAIIVAYVMRYKQWPLKKAYKYVRSKRAIVEINMGFLYQLIDYEQQLFGATSIPKSMIKR